MYNFNNWKEAINFILGHTGTELITLKLDNPKDCFFLREAARKYKIQVGNNFGFSFSDDSREFSFKFETEDRQELTAPETPIIKKLKAIAEGDSIEILNSEHRIGSVRVEAYKRGLSVQQTETGCIVSLNGKTPSLRSQVLKAINEINASGDFIDISASETEISAIRCYVSQIKRKEERFSTQELNGIARITKIK